MFNVIDNAAHAWRYAADFVRDRRGTRRTVKEVEALDADHAARLLADAGYTREDFLDAMSRPFASEDLLVRGMESVGLDPARFKAENPEWMRYLQQNCAMCDVRGHCKWVMAYDGFVGEHGKFCPNSEDFRLIQARGQAGSAE
jgi:hypothetical protein